MSKSIQTGLIFAALTLTLAACGEYSQVAQYKPGSYAGKSDTRPWEGGQFAGDKAAWEAALANRNQAQNEYKKAN